MSYSPDELEVLRSLLEFLPTTSRATVAAVIEHQGCAAAAAALGRSKSSITRAVSRARKMAARRGWEPSSPLNAQAPDGYYVRGKSTYYRLNEETGEMEPRGGWIKTDTDREEQLELFMERMREWSDSLTGFAPPVPRPPPARAESSNLVNVLLIGDAHYGMLGWGPEVGGRSFDLGIALRTMRAAIDDLFERAPRAEICYIIDAGDTFHADNNHNQTTKGTPVSTDSRRPKVIDAVLDIKAYIIDRALRRHPRVIDRWNAGNHDKETVQALRPAWRRIYRNEPRVLIDDSPAEYCYRRFGKVLIGTAHGETAKPLDLGEIMACDAPEDWGNSRFRQWYVGHVHHKSVTDLRGCSVTTMPTLAGMDAYHYAHGYRSARCISIDTWNVNTGLCNQTPVGIARIDELLEQG